MCLLRRWNTFQRLLSAKPRSWMDIRKVWKISFQGKMKIGSPSDAMSSLFWASFVFGPPPSRFRLHQKEKMSASFLSISSPFQSSRIEFVLLFIESPKEWAKENIRNYNLFRGERETPIIKVFFSFYMVGIY